MDKYKTKVKIIGCSSLGEQLAAASGRISTQPGSAIEVLERSKDAEKNENLIAKVTRSGHDSIIEHAVFHIGFEDVSVFAEQFFIEFRLASFTVKSRRYVDFSNAGYYLPDFGSKEVTEEYKKLMAFLFDEYKYFCNAEIQKEDARFLLPYSLHSNFYCTVNGRELLLMLKSLLFGRGSRFSELKNIGQDLFAQLEGIAPGISKDFIKRNEGFDNRLDFSDLIAKEDTEEYENEDLVSLIAHTERAEFLAAKTALMATNQVSETLAEQIIKSDQSRKDIIKRLVGSKRPRALEHLSYTFGIKGVSLATLTHFTRHRIQSIDIPALTNINRSNYILPPSIKNNPQLLERYRAAFKKVQDFYNILKSKGVEEEKLVYTLLSGNALDFVFTMNARELRLFFNLRTCNRAQWEIRNYSDKMLNLCRQTSPEIFCHYGPGCYTSKCPEGPMTCGQMQKMKKRYSEFNI